MSSKIGKSAGRRWTLASGASALAAAAAAMTAAPALAQDAEEEETIVITGTRITLPGLDSASPITTVGSEEIELQNEPEIERILAAMPGVLAADGQNRNNGTLGVATVNLRGLGPQRNLIMIDGRRLVPFDMNGIIDTQQIPTAFVERIDVVTGGASAVYGSDAISGAVNFIMKEDFEGVEFDYNRSITGEDDGEINTASVSLGANVADGRGNVALNMNYSLRDAVLLGQRPLGRLGIVTADGSGLAEFLAGNPPTPPSDPLCQGENAVGADQSGSPTTLPTRIAIPGSAAFVNAGLQQFRTDGSLGANCSVFNFNPYNYYQTPQERFGATAIANYEVNDNIEAYGRFIFASTRVRSQVAPSGLFGSPFWTNMDNPLIGLDARTAMIAAAEGARGATIVEGANWRDNDSSGTVTAPDDLLISFRRRTVEFGPRITTYDADSYQIAVGLRGEIGESGWEYDAYLSQGGVASTVVNEGFTNTSHLAEQVLTTDGVTCRDSDDTACVPINLFGPPITDAAAIAYGLATSVQTTDTRQTIFNATLSGSVPGLHGPWASTNAGVSFGYEYRAESVEFTPDECLRIQPDGCLGGAGGFLLPFAGDYDVHEVFGEVIMPIAEDRPLAESLDLELGYRISDYDVTGRSETFKAGLNWEPVEGLRFRAMRQRAIRAPNLGELFSPVLSSLANAVRDPCSVANAAAFPANTELMDLCISTGMTAAQVGQVADGVIVGQIQIFNGTDPNAPAPSPETAETTTIGIVWNPTLPEGFGIQNPVVSLDWYNIEVEDFIGGFGAQEVLDACYVQGLADMCTRIRRVSGELGLPGAGVELFTENLMSAQAEGLELGAAFSVDFGSLGALDVGLNANKYLTQQSQSATFLSPIDCLGHFGNQCGNPLPEYRWTQRTSWSVADFTFSYLWRHVGEAGAEPAQVADTFPQFREIDAFDYFDLSAQWHVTSNVRFDASVRNATDEDPPVVGNEAGTTSTNSGNTFPAVYDTLGRVYAVGFNVRF